MNRKIFLLTLMSVSLCLTPCVAYAAQGETDMYGNPIDWDENGMKMMTDLMTLSLKIHL